MAKDMKTVFGKRGYEQLDKLGKLAEELKPSENPVEPSDAHVSTISAQPGPEQGSTNDVEASIPNPSSSPTHPDPLTDPSSSESPMMVHADVTESDIEFMLSDHESDFETTLSEPTEVGSDHELTPGNVPQLKTNKRPSAGQDEPFPWDHWMEVLNGPDWKRPKLASSKDFVQPHYQVVHGQQSNHAPGPLTDSHDFFGPGDLLPPLEEPELLSKGFGQAHEEQSSPRPLIPWLDDPRLLTKPESWEVTTSEEDPLAGLPNASDHVVPVPEGPPQSPELTDPELHSVHQSLSTKMQPVDVLDAIYKVKGKVVASAGGSR